MLIVITIFVLGIHQYNILYSLTYWYRVLYKYFITIKEQLDSGEYNLEEKKTSMYYHYVVFVAQSTLTAETTNKTLMVSVWCQQLVLFNNNYVFISIAIYILINTCLFYLVVKCNIYINIRFNFNINLCDVKIT